ELEDYLSHDPSFATDPYEFWQSDVNSAKYPLTKKLALKYLSAPGISIGCQSVFSRLEAITSELRTSWEPDELEKLSVSFVSDGIYSSFIVMSKIKAK
ncbi:dimerization domain protein, hAT family, partial [Teladorsagia circumcincta]